MISSYMGSAQILISNISVIRGPLLTGTREIKPLADTTTVLGK